MLTRRIRYNRIKGIQHPEGAINGCNMRIPKLRFNGIFMALFAQENNFRKGIVPATDDGPGSTPPSRYPSIHASRVKHFSGMSVFLRVVLGVNLIRVSFRSRVAKLTSKLDRTQERGADPHSRELPILSRSTRGAEKLKPRRS
jgi:hypothetical protein